ncbi:hypothetical protein B0J14DRAFT_97535 [Halenospora varia]|nr:hypothetical protein B0J14DRAFT_97535 [Halenospora varia]
MKTTNFLSGVASAASFFVSGVLAQDFATHGTYTEPNTGMTFYTSYISSGAIQSGGYNTQTCVGGFTFGMTLPPEATTTNKFDYLGLIIGSTPAGNGWSGVVHGDNIGASMPNHLMLMAWPSGTGNDITTSLRYSSGYQLPTAYKGSASISKIYTSVNATNWVMVYKCTNCLLFDDPSQSSFNASTSAGEFAAGWGQAVSAVTNKADANSDFQQHDNGMGVFKIKVASATHASYSKWAASATAVPTSTVPTSTPTPTGSFSSIPVPTGTTWDYVIVGGGAAGIPMADRLSATGKSVLLIEKGIPASARWGGTLRPENGWLDGTNLTWFDIPGECNRIWNGGSAGVACTDTDQMAGCVLGGGTSVNAGLWFRANPADWDYNFPAGWKATDMVAATNRVFQKIPGTDHPSLDGKLYVQSGFDVVSKGLAAAKWTSVTANNVPSQKNRTFAHTPYMSSNGERGGPQATYLVSAMARKNFQMWLNTSVERVNRVGGHATSLDVIAQNNGGRAGTVQLTPVTGRVIIASGTFGTAKLLFRSGIGPTDMLEVVQSSTDGPKMINSTQWINLPVGSNLIDHLNTDTVLSHPDISYYDWPAAWLTPIEQDKTDYLTKRIGPLTQAAPNIGPMMWEVIKGPDGIERQFQWTARVEGSGGVANGNTMTLSLYLGRGSVSRGRTTIGKGLNMVVSTIPYGDKNDLATVAMALDSMVAALKPVGNLTWVLPPSNITGAEYLASIPLTYANVGARRSNHWMGSAKLGTDSGLTGGTSVVDTNTKVYGTDNIFVIDASIFPGMPTTNPSAYIVVASEHAADLIQKVPFPKTIAKNGQCGGLGWTGTGACAAGLKCTIVNVRVSKCV